MQCRFLEAIHRSSGSTLPREKVARKSIEAKKGIECREGRDMFSVPDA